MALTKHTKKEIFIAHDALNYELPIHEKPDLPKYSVEWQGIDIKTLDDNSLSRAHDRAGEKNQTLTEEILTAEMWRRGVGMYAPPEYWNELCAEYLFYPPENKYLKITKLHEF